MKDVLIEKLNREEIINVLYDFFTNSNFSVLKFQTEKDFFDISIKDVARRFNIRMVTKNITGCGWKEKPEIKRIQTVNLSDRITFTNKVSIYISCVECL